MEEPLTGCADRQGRTLVQDGRNANLGRLRPRACSRRRVERRCRLGDESFEARAVVATGQERDRLYGLIPDGPSAYQQNTDCAFPIVVLEGVPAPTPPSCGLA